MVNQFVVERGVPLPPQMSGPGLPCKYPWDTMKVGDSFFINGNTKSGPGGAPGRLRKNGYRTAQRKVEGGIRVWRIA